MKIDLELAAQQTEAAEQSLAYLKFNCRSGIMYNEKDARWHIRRARLCLDKVERILSELKSNEDEQPQLQQTDVSRSAETEKPLTECMMGRDTECDHPKCPVTDEDAANGRYCTLPLYDWRT